MIHKRTWACDKPDGDGCDGEHMTQPTQKDRETALQIVYLIGNAANRPDLRELQERQVEAISHAIAKAREEEREECAKVADDQIAECTRCAERADAKDNLSGWRMCVATASLIARFIRDRKLATEGGK